MNENNMRGAPFAFWCCVLFFINIQFPVVPMHHLFLWSPLCCIFMIVYFQKGAVIVPVKGRDGNITYVKEEEEEDVFKQVVWFLLLYGIIAITFSASFGLQYIFGLKRLILPS